MDNERKLGPNRGNAGKGRPKGAVNKSTRLVKEAIERAAEALGGAERLAQWAQEDPANERAFWKDIYPKLLPLQVTAEGGAPLIPPSITFVRQ